MPDRSRSAEVRPAALIDEATRFDDVQLKASMPALTFLVVPSCDQERPNRRLGFFGAW